MQTAAKGGTVMLSGPNKRTALRFAGVHLVLAACAALFPLYRYLVGLLPRNMTGCILHDWFFLYCYGLPQRFTQMLTWCCWQAWH